MHVENHHHHFALPEIRTEIKTAEPLAPSLPPVVISPTEVDHISVTLEKNQQCACKDCGKLFNSVWYLKQHAVKHSNDRPFRCKFCFKTYKFRSNLYQHKCPDRVKSGNAKHRLISRNVMPGHHTNPIYLPNGNSSTLQTSVNFPEDFSDQAYRIPGYGPTISMVSLEATSYSASTAKESPLESREEGHQKVSETDEVEDSMNKSTRKRSLDQSVVDEYIQRNKHKLFQCRKCRIQFPSREYLSRHTAYHSELDTLTHKCPQCPQKFSASNQLDKHVMLHSKASGVSCSQCTGNFRSMLALRRHKDRCRQCSSPPFGIPVDHIMETASCAIDEYAFIDAEEAKRLHSPLAILDDDAMGTKGTDSGLGSEGSTHSCTTSPARSSVHIEDDEGFEVDNKRNFPQIAKLRITVNGQTAENKKKDDEDEDGSRLRRRLSSGAHSGSPGSAYTFSSDDSSPPTHKSSLPSVGETAGGVYGHYNAFVSAGHTPHFSAASHQYVNNGVAGRAARSSFDSSEDVIDDLECGHSVSDTVGVMRRSVLQPRLLKCS